LANATIQIGSASFDPGTQRLQVGEQEIRLDPKESAVLLELAASAPRRGSVLSGRLLEARCRRSRP
jgi:DNA-binding response OmpR family regulator